jgi:hypothetical protein
MQLLQLNPHNSLPKLPRHLRQLRADLIARSLCPLHYLYKRQRNSPMEDKEVY